MMSEVFVESTARDVFIRDFDIVIASNGVTSRDEDIHWTMLKVMDEAFGVVFPVQRSKEIFS